MTLIKLVAVFGVLALGACAVPPEEPASPHAAGGGAQNGGEVMSGGEVMLGS